MKSLLLILVSLVQGSLGYRVVCVYTNWSQYRPDGGKFMPEDVDPTLCTHLIYVYAKLKGNKLEPTEWNDEGSAWSEGMFERVNNLKQLNPELKTLLGVGGWMMGSKDFSKLASGRISRKIFAKTSAKFLRDRNFDGLSIDWQHPTKRGGKPKDKVNFSLLLKEIRKTFEAESKKSGLPPLLLTTGVSASREVIEDGYEIDNITRYTDFINVMAYDLHGAWDNYTGHPSQLYPREEEFGPSTEINVDAAMRYWMSNVPDRSKLILGVSTYGRTFTLRKARHNDYNVPSTGPGVAGEFTQQPGMLAYYERCSQYPDAQRVWDAPSQVAYWYSGNQWMAGEDIESVKAKVNWTRTYDIGGMMIWSLDTDDFVDKCLFQVYPLLNTIVEDLNDPTFVKPNITFKRKVPKISSKLIDSEAHNNQDNGLSNIKTLENKEIQLKTDTDQNIALNIQSTTTIRPTTQMKSEKVKSDMNKSKNNGKQNRQRKIRAQIVKKKKQQQKNKTQYSTTSKPNIAKPIKIKRVRKTGRRRRINPKLRRKMLAQRRQRIRKRVTKARKNNGKVFIRKGDKSTVSVDPISKSNETSSTNNQVGKEVDGIVPHKVQTKPVSKSKPKTNEQVTAVMKEKNIVNNAKVKVKEAKLVKEDIENKRLNNVKEPEKNKIVRSKNSSDTSNTRGFIQVKDIILKGENKRREKNGDTKSVKHGMRVTVGKTLRITRKKKAKPILIVRQKSEGKRNTKQNDIQKTKSQQNSNQESTSAISTKQETISKDTASTKKNNKANNIKQKPLKKQMKWRRRKVSKSGRRLKVRRQRKKPQHKS